MGEGVKSYTLPVCWAGLYTGQTQPESGRTVQVLGELAVPEEGVVLKARLCRDMTGLDCAAHYRAVTRIQSHLPLNIRRR